MTTPAALTAHEDRILDDLLGVVDYAGRVLIAAAPGSMYQLDKAHGLRREVDRLIRRLEQDTISSDRSVVVAAKLASEARRYTLGAVLADSGHLGGTA